MTKSYHSERSGESVTQVLRRGVSYTLPPATYTLQ